jgi:hypothetical protein
MKWLFFLLLAGCSNPNENLRNHLLTDDKGCKYFVEIGIGEVVFLHKIELQECK